VKSSIQNNLTFPYPNKTLLNLHNFRHFHNLLTYISHHINKSNQLLLLAVVSHTDLINNTLPNFLTHSITLLLFLTLLVTTSVMDQFIFLLFSSHHFSSHFSHDSFLVTHSVFLTWLLIFWLVSCYSYDSLWHGSSLCSSPCHLLIVRYYDLVTYCSLWPIVLVTSIVSALKPIVITCTLSQNPLTIIPLT